MSNPQRIFMSTRSVYIWSLSILAMCAALFVVPFVVGHGRQAIRMHPTHLILSLLLIYAHELLHLVGFRAFGGLGRSDIGLRMSWRYLIPHVDLRVPVAVRRCRIATLLPGVVTGLVPLLAGLWLANGQLLVIGALMTAAAGGDLAIVAALRGLEAQTKVELSAAWARPKR